MRILIVEDEISIREGIRKYLVSNTDYEIVGEACDGAEGLRMITELKPDVVLTDIKMPEMTGLEMLRKTAEKGIGVYSLILTGFADFEYAKEGISLGVSDYILKPIDMNHLTSVLSDIDRKMHHEEVVRASVPQLLWSLLTVGEADTEAILNDLKNAEQSIRENTRFLAYLLEFGEVDSPQIMAASEIVKNWTDTEVFETVYSINLGDSILLLFVNVSAYDYFDKLMTRKLFPKLFDKYDCVAARSSFTGAAGLRDRVVTLKKMCSLGFNYESGTIIGSLYEKPYKELPDTKKLMRSVADAFKTGRLSKDGKEIKAFIDNVVFSDAREGDIKRCILELTNELIHESFIKDEEERGFVNRLLHLMTISKTKEHLLDYFDKILDVLSAGESITANTDNAVILEAISYIRKNFTRDISLTDVSEAVGVSSVYLSRLFSKELGTNFVAFVKEFRLSTAKRLLADRNTKVKDVAEKTGFANDKYFMRVFKEETGMTPKEYSEKMNQ